MSVGFSPASITCFFSPHIGSSPLDTYSKGCAINLSQGVTAKVEAASVRAILVNGESKSIAPVEYLIQKLAPEAVCVELETPLPLGCGFGLSAAACLAAAFAIVAKYNLKLSRQDIGMLAHKAEVFCKTGLGDVNSQLYGGVVFRHCQKGPLDSLRLSIKDAPLYYRVFGDIKTSDTLSNSSVVKIIAQEGALANDWVVNNMDNLSLEKIIARARDFAQQSNLITDQKVRQCIEDVVSHGGQATMIMLGQAVLSTKAIGDIELWTKTEIDQEGSRYKYGCTN